MPDLSVPHGSPAKLEHAECHALGHQWRHRNVIGIDDPGDFARPFGASTGMVGYRSQCSNCKTERIKWITRSGEVINRYDYAEGYSRRGDDRLSAHEWRESFAVSLFSRFEQFEAEHGKASRRKSA